MKQLLILMGFCILFNFCSLPLYSQSFVVTGQVTTGGNRPVEGVSVRSKQTSAGASSEDQGKYRIQASNPNDILVFSSIGYIEKEVAVNAQSGTR